MAVVVLMPAFNEQHAIGEVISGLPKTVHQRSVRVTVVDDGSTDDTAMIAAKAGADVITSDSNRGKGHALRLGMERIGHSDLEALVWMDADGQHRPEELPAITDAVLHGDADMVVGSRYLSTSKSKAPLNRRLVRRAAIESIRSVSGIRLTDPFSGYRCFSPAGVDVLDLEGDRYECELEAFFCVARSGLMIEEVAIPRVYTTQSSKMGYHRGRVLGRFDVLKSYARTIQLHGSSMPLRTRPSINA